MDRFKLVFVFLSLLAYCSCEISYEKKNKLVNGFVDFYNSLPNQIYVCEEGYLQNAQQSTEQNSYEIEVALKVSERHLDSKKYLKCTGKVVDLDEVGVSVLNHRCEETEKILGDKGAEIEELAVTETVGDAAETTFVRKPIQLDNEVQTNTAVTSGEQFIAIPREEQKIHCIGCATLVNPQAPGVSELAAIGVRQLNSLEPNVQHTLNSVVTVERQVQVVNGIRYVLTLIIDYNSCLTPETETCLDSKACKISILEKPWMLLPDGSKYRAILANNCTEEWRFGDNGVVVPQTPSDSRENNNIHAPQTDGSDIIKAVNNVDVQAQPHTEKTLTDDDIKALQQQIIPNKQFESIESETPLPAHSEPTEISEPSKEHIVKVESASQSASPNAIPSNSVKIDNLSDDKKKAIDDMLNFFNFAGIDSARPDEDKTRLKRSYDKDLNVMNLLEKFQKVKNNVENAKYIYKLAQIVVDYLNEMDLEVKTRVLKDVINAEEELENHQHFYYIQSRVVIPCDKSECEEKDTIAKICNAVLDGTNKNVQILNVFCHDEPKAKPLGKVNSVALDDPVLLKLIKEAINKIESESTGKAMKVNKVIDANTQKVSGTLTKFSIMLDYTNCNKTVPPIFRSKCSIVEELGSQICDVTVHERHWLKEKKLTYTCTERPVDSSFSNIRKSAVKKSVNDPAVLDMVNEALQYLDIQSNRNSKQIVVRVNSVATKLVAGFLTDIEFVVGYTTCTNDVKRDNSKCKLLEGEPLRTCKAKVWDRTWIEDGRQVDVSCKEPSTEEKEVPKRMKRDLGAPADADVKSPEIKQLAKDALRKYLQSSVYNRHFDIIDIHRATVQVVAGSLTKLEFKISPTTCLIDKEGYPSSSDCQIIDRNDVTTCLSATWEKKWLNFKEINTTCEVDRNTRLKRESVGAAKEEDPNKPKFRDLANESMRKYLQTSGITKPHSVVDIIKVTTQVVAGSLTRIQFKISPADQKTADVISCDSKIWEQPWTGLKEIDVNCGIDNQSRKKREVHHESYTARRLLNFVGGQKNVDVDNPEFKTLAKESLQKFLQSSGGNQHYGLISIEKATVQVVSGVLTKIEFSISPTNCQVNSDGKPTSSNCKVIDSGDIVRCSSEILEQKWRNSKNIDVTCHVDDLFNRDNRQKTGGQMKQDPNDPKYRKLAEESMQKYLHNNGKTNPHKIVTIEKVTTQIVTGILTIIKFKISPTDQMTADIISCRSEIMEQSWNDYKEITVNCDTDNQSRVKRQLAGGQTDQDPNDPQYKALAKESMQKYLQTSGITKPHRVVEIMKVTTQVVAGLMTRIQFKISPADQETEDVITCNSKIWEQTWQNLKEIDVNCGIDDQSRVKRQLAGGQTDQDPNDPQYKALAKESMQKYLQTSGITKPHRVVEIMKVTTQVVAGLMTRIQFKISPADQETEDVITCNSKIWEQTWQNLKEIDVNCGIDDQSRVKRQLAGGQTDQDPNDPQYKALAKESMQKYLQTSGITKPHRVVEIMKVTTQVVAGLMTRIQFKISPADQETEDVITCNSKIWEQTWQNLKEIDVNCGIDDQSRVKRQLAGGQTDQDPNDPQYKALAKESMQKYLQTSGITKQHRVVEIMKVTTQVVAGLMTRIQFKISPADQETEDVITCNSKIWEKTWQNFKEIDVNCGIDDQSRVKRQLAGGQTDQDPNDPQYKALAKESMQKYLQTSGITKQHRVVEIMKVTTQVVAGLMTRIQFKISPADQETEDVITCNSKIWEKTWQNLKEIDVNCGIDDQSRVKRQLAGGQTDQDPNDPQYKALAKESMQKYLQTSGITKPHRVVEIMKVTTQVVAGLMTRIHFKISPADQETEDVITCNSKIWEQTWQNLKEIDVNCGIDDQSRVKRQLAGGQTDQDPNDPQYKALAKESMQKYLQTSGITKPHRVVEIMKVTTQVVAGLMTRIQFKISPADQETGDVITCNSKIWEKTWQNLKEIDVSCGIDDQSRVKRQLAGGQTDQDPNDPQYKALAKESMQKYLQTSGITKPHRVVEIMKVTTQVVAGSMTRIQFKISPADQETEDVITCYSKIWEQPWQNFKEIDVNCGIDDQSRAKREIVRTHKSSVNKNLMGGVQEQDPTKILYKELAQASLQKYLKMQKNSNLHNVIEVKKVTSQVVSGVIYNIEYTAAPKFCADDVSTCMDAHSVLHCSAEVWDQPWLGKKHIKVSCRANNMKKKTRSLELKDIEETMHEEEHRGKRQAEDDYVEEDISFYYAERAISQLNEQTNSNNLHKLITIHGSQNSMHMNQPMVRMYIETAETYCLRHRDENILPDCEELDGMNHQLCLVRLWPSQDDELVVKQVSLVCDDDDKFESISGISIPILLKASIREIEKSPSSKYKLVHQGEPQVIPTLDSTYPIILNFVVASTNCSKNVQVDLNTPNNYNCFIDISRQSKACQSRIWLVPNSRNIRKIIANCGKSETRRKRSVSLNPSNSTADELIIQNLVKESLHKLEMASSNRYKQRVLQINSYSTKITSGKITTIDFDVAYTSCLKFEWVEDEKICEFLEHLPRRHCVSQVWERLWVDNGRNIEVTCEEDETPLEAHVEFESAETAMQLANEALKHIEAKYPHPRKQKVIRIFSLEKQIVAGIHYRMKIEVGPTQCSALSAETTCKLDKDGVSNKFCRVNVWLRPWTNHAPNFRVSCDYQEGATTDLYHHLQAEQLFHDFLTTYKPEYINNPNEMSRKFEIFKANVRKIHELNTHEKGTATYGVTRFADLSYDEFTTKFLGLKPSLRDTNQVPMRQAEIPKLHIPEKFDWRDYDAVTEVKNQGSCGSCWAFSVTGNIEGQWKMQSGQLVSLSEQELVDCDKLDQGCNGGLPDNAYRAIEQLGGLELENDYPYEGEDDKCSFNKTLSRVKITGAVNITSNETDMAKWLVQNGPISIGINANAMQFYMGGVSHPWKMLCNPTNLDHGVLIVGYGIKDYPLFHKRLPYWTIKNSWGPGWGEQGYYRVFRGDGTCGVNQMASSAVI